MFTCEREDRDVYSVIKKDENFLVGKLNRALYTTTKGSRTRTGGPHCSLLTYGPTHLNKTPQAPPFFLHQKNPRRLGLPFRFLCLLRKGLGFSSPVGRHGDDSQRREAPGGIVLPAALADQARQGELELLLLLLHKAGIRYGLELTWTGIARRRWRRRRRLPRPKRGRRRRQGRARAPNRGRSCFRSARRCVCVGFETPNIYYLGGASQHSVLCSSESCWWFFPGFFISAVS